MSDTTPLEDELTPSTRDSILKSVKNAISVGTDYDPFDEELIMYINGIFSTLHQVGVGPIEPYSIEGEENLWSEFIGDNKAIESVKVYIKSKVKLIFDPPPNSFGITALEKVCSEFEWRLQVQGETP